MLKRIITLPLMLGLVATTGCILRQGMNAECRWPPEAARTLDLTMPDDERHLVTDTELVDELVDRFRFNPSDAQQRCYARLVAEVARIHAVTVTDVARARERNADRGLNLPVVIPMVGLILLSSHLVLGRIELRFGDEAGPRFISLAVACVAISATFVYLGEFWTSLLQMIRVGSQHVGGRVNKLPWLQHQGAAFLAGIGLFWTVVLLRWLGNRTRRTPRPVE